MIDGLQKATYEANAVKDQHAARVIHHFLRLRLEDIKEKMIDDESEILRGRAQEIRTLLKRMTESMTPTEDEAD